MLRELEKDAGRPIGILADLQGPKLRVGTFADGPVMLAEGSTFQLDLDCAPGNSGRAGMPHPEIFAALVPGAELLLDDGKLRPVVERCAADFAETRVLVGGKLSERKGVNVPGVVLPITAACDRGVDHGFLPAGPGKREKSCRTFTSNPTLRPVPSTSRSTTARSSSQPISRSAACPSSQTIAFKPKQSPRPERRGTIRSSRGSG
jgi:hypothetical protein